MSFKKNSSKLPEDFDSEKYLQLNPDVAAAKVDPKEHFLTYGINENRIYKDTNEINETNELSKICAKYNLLKPQDINSFNLFKGSWSTIFSDKNNQNITDGFFDGTRDERLDWLSERFNVENKKVLELGPLEAGHTYMLENNGADVTSIESNIGAFLRCLIVKNQYNLNTKFLLGDFTKTVFDENQFDLVVASGVLYHMTDPIQFLKQISNYSKSLYLWTHYFEPDLKLWNPALKNFLEQGKWNYTKPKVEVHNGLSVRIIKQHYGNALGWDGFCGGPEEYSYWIMREDLLNFLKKLGFNKIDIGFDHPMSPNGPSFSVFAEK